MIFHLNKNSGNRMYDQGNPYTAMFAIGVDDVSEHQIRGRMGQIFCGKVIPFCSLDDCFMKMDYLMDQQGSPRPGRPRRFFDLDHGEAVPDGEMLSEQDMSGYVLQNLEEETGNEIKKSSGALSNFLVTVYFRQNGSWQGSIVWLRSYKDSCRAHFSSALELMHLLWSALASRVSDASCLSGERAESW